MKLYNINAVLSGVLFSLVFAACKKQDTFELDASKYLYPIPQVNLTESARVGAFYSQYKSTDWTAPIAFTPVLGSYDPLSPSVMQQHVAWADQGGVDFFVFRWNATTDNALLDNFNSQAASGSVKMVIDFNTAHLKATNTSPLVGAKLQTFVNEWKTLANNYISQNTYYKIGDRPVLMLSPLNLTTSTANSINYKLVADTLRQVMKSLGHDPYIIGELTTGWVAPLNYPDSVLKAMDGIVLTNWSTTDYDRAFAFFSYSDLNWQNWKKNLEAWNVDYVPCIFPGYNNPSSSTQYVIDRNEKNYVDYCNVAKRSMGKERIILVNTWNDFKTGTQLEPATEYSTNYLALTKRELKKE